MIVKRDNLEALDRMNVSDAKVLCLCPICGKLSDILTSDALLDEVICKCGKVMELLMVEV